MGLFDRWLNRPAPARRQPAFEPTYELTVRIGDDVSSIEIPIEPDWGFSTESAARGPRQTASQCWIPASREVEIGGRRIRGLIYVGENLAGADTEYWLEPALIDPTLPATTAAPGEPPAGYWPSYDRLSAGHRGSYLDWLAGPRRIGKADPSYLFLYFYGLERRLLFDAKHNSGAAAERGTLVAELRRMGGETTDDQHSSFVNHLTNLLDFIAAQDQLSGVGDAEPPREKVGRDVPMALRLMMGEVAAAQLPLPAELATSWVLTSPEACLRTPAERCATEFADLFELRYRERFGEGLTLPSIPLLSLCYRPASRGLDEVDEQTKLPDVCQSTKLIEPLRELGRDCCTELDAYSRWLGRNPEGAGFKGTALLPAPLLAKADNPQLQSLRDRLEQLSSSEEPWLIEGAELIDLWSPGSDKLPKKEAVMVAQLLEKLGYGIEPDQRFGGPALKRETLAVLFRGQAGDPRAPSPAYAAASLLLHLLAAVAAADGVVNEDEEEMLESHIHGAGELYEGERHRLRAHAHWLVHSPPKPSSLRKRLEALPPNERRAVAHAVITLAAADGEIDPVEVKTLQKIFSLLDLDPESVYSDLHAITAGDEPVVVREGRPEEAGRPIPPRPETEERKGLDRNAIDEKIEETAAVSSLLAGIFVEPEDEPEPAASEPTTANANGLDRASAAFLEELGRQESWTRQDVEQLAAKLELMVDGTLESLNELAFDLCGEPLAEGDEPIEVDVEIAKEMQA
jgi:uncharacterized tellurite resistance protein B-like protein